MKDSVDIGLIGFRTIGSGVVETFNQNLGICKPKTNSQRIQFTS